MCAVREEQPRTPFRYISNEMTIAGQMTAIGQLNARERGLLAIYNSSENTYGNSDLGMMEEVVFEIRES